MINTKELRIGNWYKWSQFASMGMGCDKIYNGEDIDKFETLREPIILTEEILELIGFSHIKHSYLGWEPFAFKDTTLCAHWDGTEWCFKNGYESESIFASCKYLHEFQNLLYILTHEEIEISRKDINILVFGLQMNYIAPIEETVTEIINKFYQPLGYLSPNANSQKLWEHAKQNAMFYVDGIQDEIKRVKIKPRNTDAMLEYWQEVKSAIESA